jgi:NADPH:quinone reductase-like Zn-dependent oxidoreductase
MRAVVCTRYGPPEVLQLAELPEPVPRRDQVRIKMRATAVTSSDCLVRSLNLPLGMRIAARLAVGMTRPRRRVLGMVVAGEIDAVGKDVSRFTEGDQVFGFDRFAFGGYAEYKCMAESGVLAARPSSLSYEEAAAIPYGGLLALHFLRRVDIQAGHKVLVYGASGAVGTSAVQLARHFGAEVTGVCSTANLELVRSLGADAVIDYTKADFTTIGERYDRIFVAVGNRVHPPSRADCRTALAPDGAYVSVDEGGPVLRAEDLLLLRQLAETGELRPVIDRCYPLKQIADAHRYVEGGHKRGNVIVTVRHEPREPGPANSGAT